MKLSDLIIEHGPYVAGGAMPFPTAQNGHPIITAVQINELREELMAARKAGELRVARIAAAKALKDLREAQELGERYEVWGLGSDEFGAIVLGHRDCPDGWQAEMETTDDQPTLAGLNQRAGEHAEVCR